MRVKYFSLIAHRREQERSSASTVRSVRPGCSEAFPNTLIGTSQPNIYTALVRTINDGGQGGNYPATGAGRALVPIGPGSARLPQQSHSNPIARTSVASRKVVLL